MPLILLVLGMVRLCLLPVGVLWEVLEGLLLGLLLDLVMAEFLRLLVVALALVLSLSHIFLPPNLFPLFRSFLMILVLARTLFWFCIFLGPLCIDFLLFLLFHCTDFHPGRFLEVFLGILARFLEGQRYNLEVLFPWLVVPG